MRKLYNFQIRAKVGAPWKEIQAPSIRAAIKLADDLVKSFQIDRKEGEKASWHTSIINLPKKCGCGMAAVGSTNHREYCPLYKKEE